MNPLENYSEEEQRIMEERDAEAQRIENARIAKEQYDKYRKEVATQAAAKASAKNMMQGGKNAVVSLKKAALKNLKEHKITPTMLESAFYQTQLRKGKKVVSKMFGFTTSGHLTNDHVLELKNKDGTLFRYKRAYGKPHVVIMAKILGSPYEEIMTYHSPDYGADEAIGLWETHKHESKHVTAKLRLKPKHRKTRKNRR